MLMTQSPMMFFPTKIAELIVRELNTTYSYCAGAGVVQCETVDSLPKITIGLGSQEYELKGQDYVIKFESESCTAEGPQCIP